MYIYIYLEREREREMNNSITGGRRPVVGPGLAQAALPARRRRGPARLRTYLSLPIYIYI